MKNVPRREVIQFLQDKQMSLVDIEIAYTKAAQDVMTPDERVKYLEDLSTSRAEELLEQKRMNEYLSEQMAAQAKEVEVLRELVQASAEQLLVSYEGECEEEVSKVAADDLATRIRQTCKELKQAEAEQENEELKGVHKRDLKILQQVSECVTSKKHFHALLFLHGLEPVVRDSMPQLQAFLSEYKDHEEEHEDDE